MKILVFIFAVQDESWSSPSSEIIYAATYRGIFKTLNGGNTWREISNGIRGHANIFRLAMDPSNHKRLYAGYNPYCDRDDLDMKGAGIYRTDDGGKHWKKLSDGIIGTVKNITICAGSPNVLCIVASDARKEQFGIWAATRLWRSEDYGETWEKVNDFRTACGAVHPTNPNIMYQGLFAADIKKEPVGLYRTMDKGKTWQAIDNGISFTLGFQGDRIIFANNDNKRFFLLTGCGVYEGMDYDISGYAFSDN